jgi:hypothetical protein
MGAGPTVEVRDRHLNEFLAFMKKGIVSDIDVAALDPLNFLRYHISSESRGYKYFLRLQHRVLDDALSGRRTNY